MLLISRHLSGTRQKMLLVFILIKCVALASSGGGYSQGYSPYFTSRASDVTSLGTFNARLRPSLPGYELKIAKLIDLVSKQLRLVTGQSLC